MSGTAYLVARIVARGTHISIAVCDDLAGAYGLFDAPADEWVLIDDVSEHSEYRLRSGDRLLISKAVYVIRPIKLDTNVGLHWIGPPSA